MDKDKAKEIAINKVVEMLKDIGIKMRPKEIGKYLWWTGSESERRMEIALYFGDYGERARKLKKEKNRLLNFFNVRVLADMVVFTFTLKELEIEGTGEANDVSKENIENIMKKIEKLLALAESDNEHESISASLKAQKLLKKYNLEIEAVTGKEKQEEISECVADVKSGNKWKYNLASVVARNYCCRCYYVGSERIVFYGYKSDTIIARRMFMYLFEVGCRLARTYEKNYRESSWNGAAGIYNSFCVGFTDGIEQQLNKQCTALALVVPEEVNKQYKVISQGFGTINSAINLNDKEAYQEGKTEGKRALNSQYISKDD